MKEQPTPAVLAAETVLRGRTERRSRRGNGNKQDEKEEKQTAEQQKAPSPHRRPAGCGLGSARRPPAADLRPNNPPTTRQHTPRDVRSGRLLGHERAGQCRRLIANWSRTVRSCDLYVGDGVPTAGGAGRMHRLLLPVRHPPPPGHYGLGCSQHTLCCPPVPPVGSCEPVFNLRVVLSSRGGDGGERGAPVAGRSAEQRLQPEHWRSSALCRRARCRRRGGRAERGALCTTGGRGRHVPQRSLSDGWLSPGADAEQQEEDAEEEEQQQQQEQEHTLQRLG